MTLSYRDRPDVFLPHSRDRLWLWHDLMGSASAALLTSLVDDLPWQQPRIRLFGRTHPIPRLQCWMGDPEAHYRYSGLDLIPLPWHEGVHTVRKRIETVTGQAFNSVLLNLYRDGEDRMGWHSDDEAELGDEPWVASYSLGAARRFAFRRRGGTRTAHVLELAHDTLLLMGPEVQRNWQHALPVMKRVRTPRINMTFRWVQR